MDKNSNLKIPNPRPWLVNKPSNSSLRGMEIGLLPERSIPPPEGVATYESKPLPLPPVPMRRYGDSGLSNEVNKASATPKGSIGYYEPNLNSKNEEARNIAVILDAHQVGKMKLETEIEVKSIPGTPADEVLSLHPKLSVQGKSYRPCLSIPEMPPLSSLPSGHNSSYKIKQLIGADVSPDDSTVYNVMEITPLSPISITSSSMYSEDLEASTSEPDTDVYIKLHGDTSSGARTSGTRTTHIGSDTTSWDPWELQSAMDVPFALNLTRPSDKHGFCVTKEVSESDLPQPANNHSLDSHHLCSGSISRRDFSLITTTKAQDTFSSVTPPRRNSSPGMSKENMADDPGHLGFESSPVLPRRIASVSHKNYQRHQRTPSTLAIPKMRAPPSHLHFRHDLRTAIPGPRARPNYQPPLTPYPPMRSAFDESDDDESDDGNNRRNRVEVSRVARHASTIAKAFKMPEAGGSIFRRSSRPSSASTGEAAAAADASSTSRPPTSGSEPGDKASTATTASTTTSTKSTRRSLAELSARSGRRLSAFAARTSEFARQAAAAGLKSREERRREVLKAKIRVVEAMGEHCHREEPPQLYGHQQQQQQQQLPSQMQHNSLLPPPRPAVRPPPRKDGMSWL